MHAKLNNSKTYECTASHVDVDKLNVYDCIIAFQFFLVDIARALGNTLH